MAETGSEHVAFFGGSFDPPHCAHVLAARHVLEEGVVDRVLVSPVAVHAFGKTLTAYQHRIAMCERAFQSLPSVTVSTIESRLQAPNRTLDTLQALQVEAPLVNWRLMIGADTLQDVEHWHRFDEVARLAPPLVLGRVGFPSKDAPAPVLPGIASRRVRVLLADRDGLALAALKAELPEAVLTYILAHELYR